MANYRSMSNLTWIVKGPLWIVGLFGCGLLLSQFLRPLIFESSEFTISSPIGLATIDEKSTSTHNADRNDPPPPANPSSTTVRPGTTAIVMFDTRLPVRGATGGDFSYWQQTANLNALYACAYAYDFLFYVPQGTQHTDDGHIGGHDSKHKTSGKCQAFGGTVDRGSPWCKMTGVAAAMEAGYETVVLIDSDAFLKVGHRSMSIATLERVNRGQHLKRRGSLLGYSNSSAADTAGKALYVAADYDVTKPNTGLQIWHNSPEAWELLRAWWKTNITNTVQSFEQSALISEEFKATGLQKHYNVMGRLNYQTKDVWDKLPVIHINSFLNKKVRRDVFMQALKDAKDMEDVLGVDGGACHTPMQSVKEIVPNDIIKRLLES